MRGGASGEENKKKVEKGLTGSPKTGKKEEVALKNPVVEKPAEGRLKEGDCQALRGDSNKL